jgi:pyruvate/2-oxoacid:ferredoxin oxidoreductase beta subunit
MGHLAGRAGQITLNTSTSSSLSSNGVANFFRRACQGCKKSVVIKIVVNEFADDEEYIKEWAKFLQQSC